MKIIGITRVRNESEIIKETLDHMGSFCEYVYVYDDCSNDNTVEICENHSLVKKVIKGHKWDSDRERAEYQDRQKLIDEVMRDSNINDDDWIIYLDADERVYFDFEKLKTDNDIGAIKMRLFDFYITEEDKNLHYSERKFMGPEFRDILFMYKKKNIIGYHRPDQRECTLKPNILIVLDGYVKHFGKSISIKQWEDTCEYYSRHFPKYSIKWENRKGKAIHVKSDFGRDLITWEQRTDNNLIIKIN